MSPENPPPWIRTVQVEIAEEALAILDDVIHEIDLGRTGTFRIGGYAGDSPVSLPVGNDYSRDKRTQVGQMLVARGALISAQAHYAGGSPYVADEDRGNWLVVEADEQTVRNTADALRTRLRLRPPAPRAHARGPSGPQATNTYNAPVTIVNTTGDNANVSVTVNANVLGIVTELARRAQDDADNLQLGAEEVQQLREDAAALEAEAQSAKPEKGRLRRGVEAVMRTIGKAGATVAGTALAKLAEEALKYLM